MLTVTSVTPVTGGDLLARALQRYGIAPPARGVGHVHCPVHEDGTPSCHVDLVKGVWHCFSCDKGGDGITMVREREHLSYPEARRVLGLGDDDRARPRPSAPAPRQSTQSTADDEERIRAAQTLWRASVPLQGTPGEDYMIARGIPSVWALAAGIRYDGNFMGGGPATIFPVFGRDGSLVAVQGRHLFPPPDGRDRPDKRSRGRVALGIFSTPGARHAPVLAVTEAPLDALALAVCGQPSIALMGTHAPEWLPAAMGQRDVLLATDADAAGDGAAGKLCTMLEGNGGRIFRLTPTIAKDWAATIASIGPAAMEESILTATRAAGLRLRPSVAHGFVEDLAATLTAGQQVLYRGEVLTVTAYIRPDDALPAGAVSVVCADGRHGEVDARALRGVDGRPLVTAMGLVSWRDRIGAAQERLTAAQTAEGGTRG